MTQNNMYFPYVLGKTAQTPATNVFHDFVYENVPELENTLNQYETYPLASIFPIKKKKL